MITVNNLVHHEFIGLSVSVTSVSNESLRLKGTVIDETKNTIKIEVDDNVEKIIPKKGSLPGPSKRLVILRQPIRPNNKSEDIPQINYISTKSKQGV